MGWLPRARQQATGTEPPRLGYDQLVPELAGLPDGLAVDGEPIAFGDDGLPSFPRLCDRMLHGKHHVEVMLLVFVVLVVDGRPVGRLGVASVASRAARLAR